MSHDVQMIFFRGEFHGEQAVPLAHTETPAGSALWVDKGPVFVRWASGSGVIYQDHDLAREAYQLSDERTIPAEEAFASFGLETVTPSSAADARAFALRMLEAVGFQDGPVHSDEDLTTPLLGFLKQPETIPTAGSPQQQETPAEITHDATADGPPMSSGDNTMPENT